MFKDKNDDIIKEILEEIKIEKHEVWAIYGTGKGAELVYKNLYELSLSEAVKNIIDRDEKVDEKKDFHDIPIRKLDEVVDLLDGIIIAAIDNHKIIKERIKENLRLKQIKCIHIVDIFEYVEKKKKIKYMLEYISYIEKNVLKENKEFVDFNKKRYQRNTKDTKIITWYLPQFHQIEINNKFHGQGFTEWTNTSRAIPLFVGHYQPHIPYDVGYYDLMNPSTFQRQIFLAKHYGIYGFCFHYYWFSGEKIMEQPLELFLKHKEFNMPFCLDWATENWTALWDGGDKKIMMEQRLQAGDDKKFMEDILPYMQDPRYIKIDGKPILIIYRVDIFSKNRIKRLLSNFREYAKKKGFPDLYIMITNSFDFNENVEEWGANALVEFPPHAIKDLMNIYKPDGYINPYFNGWIFNALPFIERKKYMIDHGNQTYFRSALTSWDSTARKAVSEGFVLQGLDPRTFKIWLADIIDEGKQIHSESEDFVFVNSWNEWGEGSHLEPDMKYGYAYLQAIKDVLER